MRVRVAVYWASKSTRRVEASCYGDTGAPSGVRVDVLVS
jgi:hypothetical protein